MGHLCGVLGSARILTRSQFEQLKKQKGKGQTKAAAKKDEAKDRSEGGSTSNDGAEKTGKAAEKRQSPTRGTDEGHNDTGAEDDDGATVETQPEAAAQSPATSPHKRQPSLSLQSRMRSSSFRKSSMSQGPLSPNKAKSPDLPVLTPDGDSVNAIYRKQAARLDELEKENRRLAKESQEAEKRWKQTEEELEELREASGDVAELKSRAQAAEAQMEEFSKVVRLQMDSHTI